MAMISGGDESARNAFRAHLRDDSSQLSLVSTEEMSPGDVLEVKNLGDAIERAERALRESSRPRDMFAELGTPLPIAVAIAPSPAPSSPETLTDDASGPAVYKAPTPTPIPPRPLRPVVTETLRLPVLMVPADEDAFLQPAGRMRHFAEETLDGVRVDTTAQVRKLEVGARRKTLTIVVGAIVGALAVAIGAGAIIACLPAKAESKPAPISQPIAKPITQPVVQPPAEPAATAPASTVRTMNVADLPSAR